MIAFSCPKCQFQLTRHDNEAGTKIPCPSCGQRVQVPQPARSEALGKTVVGELLPAVRSSTAPATLEADKPSSVLRCICPQCQAVIKADPRKAGSLVNCPRCARPFEVPVPLRADLIVDEVQPILPSPFAVSPVAALKPTPIFGRILVVLGLTVTLMVGLCGGFIWMGMRSERESHITQLRNQLTSSDAKCQAMDIELNVAIGRGDAFRAASLCDNLASECERQAEILDRLASFFSGMERDDLIRMAQDRRTRALTCRNNAALHRAVRP